ncbi:MAG: NAD(P)-dependent oxidoreductase [Burkholderiales bacterium]|nr:NAD(P)-dependent oxidoreductase [Burkholderiales bacterium]
MRIAVLGATGAAGRAFVPRASTAGYNLRTDRTDILDRRALDALVQGCDAAVNLATSIPKPGGRGNWNTNDRIRREGTANLLSACVAAGVRILVQQSVAMLHCAADDRPQAEDNATEGYSVLASAFDMEALVRAAPLDGRLVRGGLFYGPGTLREEFWLEEVKDRAFRIPGNGNAWVSPVHVEDYARALITVLERGEPRAAYIACDQAPLQLRELYARAAAQAGVAPPETGGEHRLRSFRVSNAKLRALGWSPLHAALRP